MAGEWLTKCPPGPRTRRLRVDVVAVAISVDGRVLAIRHLPAVM
jgi:hypothetical protein